MLFLSKDTVRESEGEIIAESVRAGARSFRNGNTPEPEEGSFQDISQSLQDYNKTEKSTIFTRTTLENLYIK